jgi:hypothetical protein
VLFEHNGAVRVRREIDGWHPRGCRCARSRPVRDVAAPTAEDTEALSWTHPDPDDITCRYRHSVTTDAELENRVADLIVAIEGLFQAANTIANNVPALANSRGPLDEIRKGLGDVAVALKDARLR